MINSVNPYSAPVERVRASLGDSFEKEYSALSLLCGLIQAKRPKKIVKAGAANDLVSRVVLCCAEMLRLPCQLHVVDSQEEYTLHTREVFDLRETMAQQKTAVCHFWEGRTLAGCADEIGGGIDLLILDVTDGMPGFLLNFISAFPGLSSDAAVALCSMLPNELERNVLFQNIAASKFSQHLKSDFDLKDCVPYKTTDSISFFQLNPDVALHFADLFAMLGCQWSYIPKLSCLIEWETFVKAHYDTMSLKRYRQAVIAADPGKEFLFTMVQSLLPMFPQILLYGKGRRGEYFLRLSRLLDIPVRGFVVSDNRNSMESNKGLPVYSISQIPFSRNETFIFQTAAYEEISQRLRESGYYWMKLPESFWVECC